MLRVALGPSDALTATEASRQSAMWKTGAGMMKRHADRRFLSSCGSSARRHYASGSKELLLIHLSTCSWSESRAAIEVDRIPDRNLCSVFLLALSPPLPSTTCKVTDDALIKCELARGTERRKETSTLDSTRLDSTRRGRSIERMETIQTLQEDGGSPAMSIVASTQT